MDMQNDLIFRREAIEAVIKRDANCGIDSAEALRALPSVQPERWWTSCSQQLPEEEEKCYWVCTDTGYQCQCRWTNNVYGIRDGDKWGWKIFDIPQYSHVVAWMPLPEPYEPPKEET